MRTPLTVAVLAVGLAGCRTAVPPPAGPSAPAPVAALRLSDGDVDAFAADDEAAYWAAGGAVWRRGWTDAAPRQLAELERPVANLIRHRDALYVVAEDGVHVVPAAGGAIAPVAPGVLGSAIAVDDDGVWIGDDDDVRVVPRGGGAPRVLAAGLRQVDAIATDRDAVYVATITEQAGARAVGDNVPPHAIWRIAKRDGARTAIADLQYGVRGLAVRDRRLVWATEAQGGVESAPLTGGAPRLLLPARVTGFAAGAGGVVVRTESGLLAEVGAGRPRLIAVPDGWSASQYQPVALAGAGVIVVLYDAATGANALWRLPRPGDDAPAVVAWTRLRPRALAADGDAVYVLDADRDPVDGWPARVVRIPARGAKAVVVTAPAIDAIAARDGALAYFDGAAVRLIEPGRPARTLAEASAVVGLTLGERAAFWIEGGVIRTVPRAGGVATTFHEPDWRSGGTGEPFAELVLDGSSLFYSSLGFGAASVFHTRGGADTRVLFDGDDAGDLGDSLAALGGDLFVVAGPSTIWRVPMNGRAPAAVITPPPRLDRLVAGGGRLYALATVAPDGLAVIAVDPAAATPQARTIARIPMIEGARVVAGPDGAYVALLDSGWIVRLPDSPRRDGRASH